MINEIEYEIRTKYIDKDVWYNANDILFMLKDFSDNLGDSLSSSILEQTLRETTLSNYTKYLKDSLG
jgi:prophage antirepressor-like protein